MIKVHPITAIALALVSIVAHGQEPQGTMVPKANLEPFLEEYCVSCHGAEKQKGDVRFDEANWKITNNDKAQRWQDVLDILNAGDMPPEDEKQPSNAEMSRALDLLTGTLLKARRRLTDHGGEISMRRLNQREYANTIRHLFGFDIPQDWVPEDGEAESFDTVGSEQFFTSSHLQDYLELGKEIAMRGFEWAAKPRSESTVNRTDPEERVTETMREKLADLDKKMAMKKAGATWQEMGFDDEGQMQIIFSQFQNRAGQPRRYLQYPLVDDGVYLAEVTNATKWTSVSRGGFDPRGTYTLRVRGGVVGSPPEIRTFVRIDDGTGPVDVAKIRGTAAKPGMIEINYRGQLGERNLNFRAFENRAEIRVLEGYLNKIDRGGEWAALWIDWMEIEGPFYDEGRAFFEELVWPEAPVEGKKQAPLLWKDENARELIERFAYEAFRHRAPTVEYVDELVALFERSRAEGVNFHEAMSEVLGVALSSPGFLFLQEAVEAGGGKKKLDDRELAIRLAYFLWSAPPDAELYAQAEKGALAKPAVLGAQVERMLGHPKAEVFIEGFASQWAELDRFDAITINETDYFLFNKGVRLSASREVREFFRVLVEENLSVSNLIDSDFAVVNGLLGHHYGIDGVDSDAFEKVALPATSPRGGLMGQTAFLAMGSNGERSSPVIRGALVMEKLLHDKPPPPPPNVPELGSDNKEPLSNRGLVEQHQQRAQCASCHEKMDVIGFGLENFDAIGKWRDEEKAGRFSFPIEPGGTLPGGAAFADLDGLKRVLLEEEDRLGEEMVESMLTYALGRTIEFSDADAVEGLVKSLKGDDYGLRSMVHGVAASELFRTK